MAKTTLFLGTCLLLLLLEQAESHGPGYGRWGYQRWGYKKPYGSYGGSYGRRGYGHHVTYGGYGSYGSRGGGYSTSIGRPATMPSHVGGIKPTMHLHGSGVGVPSVPHNVGVTALSGSTGVPALGGSGVGVSGIPGGSGVGVSGFPIQGGSGVGVPAIPGAVPVSGGNGVGAPGVTGALQGGSEVSHIHLVNGNEGGPVGPTFLTGATSEPLAGGQGLSGVDLSQIDLRNSNQGR